MLKMPSFGMNTRQEICVPLIHYVDDTLSQAMPNLHEALLQFIDVMKLMSVGNVSMHVSTPKEDILAFNATQAYKHTIKFIWLILWTMKQSGDIVLDSLEFCYCSYYAFHNVV